MNISVVVPCFNEQDNIAELYKRLINTFNKNKLELDKIILIDDGSKDNTWKKISQLQQLNKKEILGIKKLIISTIDSQVSELIDQEVRLNFFGDYSSFLIFHKL